jgi:pilus assembly protein CpaE
MDESFMAKLEELASHCDEGTAAVIIGPVNDVYLYRQMIDMGISDYLVKPISSDVMAEVCAKTLIEKIGVKGSRLIAYIGAKGGVGTSLLGQTAALGVSQFMDQKTFLLDTCGGWSTLSVGLGFEPSTTLVEAARATDAQQRPLQFGNISFSGGFRARYADTGEVYDSHTCFIDGVKCWADEARFGGIVIQGIPRNKSS